jgi:hypothetical protein
MSDVTMMISLVAPPYASQPVAIVYPVNLTRTHVAHLLMYSTKAIYVITSKPLASLPKAPRVTGSTTLRSEAMFLER